MGPGAPLVAEGVNLLRCGWQLHLRIDGNSGRDLMR